VNWDIYVKLMANFWWINTAISLTVIFFGRKKPSSTLIWVMVINFIPIVGFLLYILLARDYRKVKLFSLKEKQDSFIKLVANAQAEFIREGQFQFGDDRIAEYDDLVTMNLKQDESFLTQDNDIRLFYSGDEKFGSMLEDMENAQRSIDVQYYIFRMDTIGNQIVEMLERKVKEGVRVRFLYDSLGSRGIRRKHRRRFTAAGIKHASFFPSLLPHLNFRINYRNHRKIVVIDDKIGYVGGFNVGDDYLGRYKNIGPWRDTHARIQGLGVLGLKIRFLKDWYYASGEKYYEENEVTAERNPSGNCAIQIVTSGPDTKFTNIKNAMLRMITNAKKEIYVQTPYFIPDEGMLDAFKTAILADVQVHIMFPSNPDNFLVYGATTSYIGELVMMGARAYAYKKGFLHTKVMLVDDLVSTVGSANMDIRSFSLNFEANAFFYNEAINKELKEQFERDLEDCMELTPELYAARSKWMKAKEAVFRLFSPIL
jgi:cardiolipin synthase